MQKHLKKNIIYHEMDPNALINYSRHKIWSIEASSFYSKATENENAPMAKPWSLEFSASLALS